jgi:HEAT repeat protein
MPLFGSPNVQKLIDKRDLKKLASALSDGDGEIRDRAAQGLIQIGDSAAVPYVIDVIRAHSEQQPVIAAGVCVLREMSDRAIPELADDLRSARPEDRAAFGAILGQLGQAGMEPLLETSRDPEPGMRAIAAMGLGLIDSAEAHARLAEMVSTDDSLEGRSYAGFAMASHKLPGAYDTLTAQLDSDDPSRRAIAATNLGVLGDAQASERLRTLADSDPDQRVREAAGSAVASLGG